MQRSREYQQNLIAAFGIARSTAVPLRRILGLRYEFLTSQRADMNITIADEVERLRAAELEAERRYFQAIEFADMAAARNAANCWLSAADAFAVFVAQHPELYRDSG